MNTDETIMRQDARGLACPEPIMRAKMAMNRAKGNAVEVLVDTVTARDNVVRMAGREGRETSVTVEGDCFVVRIGEKKA